MHERAQRERRFDRDRRMFHGAAVSRGVAGVSPAGASAEGWCTVAGEGFRSETLTEPVLCGVRPQGLEP